MKACAPTMLTACRHACNVFLAVSDATYAWPNHRHATAKGNRAM